MEGVPEQVQRKLEQVFEEATDLAVQTVLAGWDRKTPLHFSIIEEGRIDWPASGVVVSRSGPLAN